MMRTDFQFIQEKIIIEIHTMVLKKKVSQRISRWSKSNDTNVDTISMWSENRWVYLEEDDYDSIIGTSYSLSYGNDIDFSDESTSNKPWEANWKKFYYR